MIFLGIAIVALAVFWTYCCYLIDARLSKLEEQRLVSDTEPPLPKFARDSRCVECGRKIKGEPGTEVPMVVEISDEQSIPVTVKVCKECVAVA